ncbi:MAG: DUF2975 domain-containing protein [Gemmatimonadetes bacterium]|nr:DUF2975 domain-containing protein [Gemmatimonadota bacterium]
MVAQLEGLQRRGLARGLKVSLDVLFYLALLVGVLLIVSLPISAFTDYDEGWDANFPVAVGSGALYPELHVDVSEATWPGLQNARIEGARGKLRFLHHSLPTHLGMAAPSLLFWGVFLWSLMLLRRILADTARGRPFAPANPQRLNVLGWIILAASIGSSLIEFVSSRWVLSKVEVTTVPLSPSFPVHAGWAVCGLLVLLLAGIWRMAVRMSEDQALTV